MGDVEDIFTEDPFESVDLPNQPETVEVVVEEKDIFHGLQSEGVGQDAGVDFREDEDENVTFLSVWEEQRKQTLQERSFKEEQAKVEIAAKAKDEMSKFHEDRGSRIEQTNKENRIAEEELKDDMAKVFKEGSVWQQVAKMVELKADPSEKKNLPERMKDILIQLKNK